MIVLAVQATAALSVLAIGLRGAGRRPATAPCRDRGLADRGAGAAAGGARRRGAPAGAVVEIGSFRGRSTVVLARAAGVGRRDRPARRQRPRAAGDRARRGARRRRPRGVPRQPGGGRRRRPRPPRAQAVRRGARGRRRPVVAAVRRRRAPLRPGARRPRATGARRVAPGGVDARARRVLLDRRDARAVRRLRGLARRGATPGAPGAWPSTSAACRPAAGATRPRRRAARSWSCRGSRATWRSRCSCWPGGGAGRSGSGSTRPRPGPTERARISSVIAGHRHPVHGDPVDRVLGVVAAAVLGADEQREHGDRDARIAPPASASCRAPIPRHRTTKTPSANSGVARAANDEPERERRAATRDRAPRAGPASAVGASRRRQRRRAPLAARGGRAAISEQREQQRRSDATRRDRVAGGHRAGSARTRSRRPGSVAGRARPCRSRAPTSGSPRSSPSQLARRPRL